MRGDTIATASRDIVAIRRRKYMHCAYRGLQKIATLKTDPEEQTTALLYPSFDSKEAFSDFLNRAAWYFPERTLSDNCELYLSLVDGLGVGNAFDNRPEAQATFDGEHLPLYNVHPANLDRIIDEVDLLLMWDASCRKSLAAIKNIKKVQIVDPEYWSTTEPNAWGKASNALRHDDGNRSSGLFRQLEKRYHQYQRSYVFATGPSLDEAMSIDFEDKSLKVVCNSIVRNETLLDHITPDILVFADPVFHFGPSRYADRFRRDAIKTLRQYDCVGVIPSQHLSLMTGHYPDVDFVAIEGVNLSNPHFPTHDDLRVMATNNIMTLFMLPIASALTDEVNVIGADGRKANESYFWEHNKSAQYDDELMKTAVDCHPSFFRDRIYTDYYDEHVRTLKSMIEYGERQGVRYYNLTHSYIPCLTERAVEDPHAHVTG